LRTLSKNLPQQENVIHYCVFEAAVLQDFVLAQFGLVTTLRIDNGEHLIVISWLDKSGNAFGAYLERCYFVSLTVYILTGFEVKLSEPLSNEGEEAAVAQAFEERMHAEGLSVDAHDAGDA